MTKTDTRPICFETGKRFDGPSYKSGLLLNYTGKALVSDRDETGTLLSRKAIGRLVNRPAV